MLDLSCIICNDNAKNHVMPSRALVSPRNYHRNSILVPHWCACACLMLFRLHNSSTFPAAVRSVVKPNVREHDHFIDVDHTTHCRNLYDLWQLHYIDNYERVSETTSSWVYEQTTETSHRGPNDKWEYEALYIIPDHVTAELQHHQL